MARVFLTRSARSALEGLDHLRAQAVLDALGEVERDPESGYRLRGRLTGLWSLRVGVYRIIYELRDDKTVRVVAIRHRGQALRHRPALTTSRIRRYFTAGVARTGRFGTV